MTFTTPLALLGLLTLPLILALHMLRSRSEQMQVSSLSLWNFLNPQVRGASARRLPLTLLLVLDLLVAALLSLALAGPRLNVTRLIREDVHRILLIDVSTSMAAADENPSRFEGAVSDIRALIAANDGGDVFTVIAIGQNAVTLADSRSEDFENQLAVLNMLIPGESGMRLDAGLGLALASVDPEIPAEVHVFTDAAFAPPAFATFELPIEWHLYGSSDNNQAVITLITARLSETKYQVFARFANFGSQAANRTAVLKADDVDLSEVEVDLDPETSRTYSWEFIGSPEVLSIELLGEDDLPADDLGFTALSSSEGNAGRQISVALVADQPGPLLRALEAFPQTVVQVISPEDYLPGSRFDLVAFRDYLPERWPGGVVLVVDPPGNSALLGNVESIPIQDAPFPQVDPLLHEIDWIGVRWDRAWQLENTPVGLDSLLTAGPLSLLLHGRVGLTELVLLNIETADENGTPAAFARHPAFPVLIANIIREAAGTQFPEQIEVGTALEIPSADRFPETRIVDPEGNETQFEENRGAFWAGLRTPGVAQVFLVNQEGIEARFLIGINAGSLTESDITPGLWPALIETPPLPVSRIEQPLSLVPWLLSAIVILLLIEAWWAWR